MNTKRFTLAALTAFSLAACTSTGNSTAAPQTPAQIAAQLCAPLEIAIAGLQADTALSTATLATLSGIAPQVQSVCAAASQATSGDVTTLENLAFNVVLPIAQERNPQLAADLLAAKIVLTAIEQAQAAQSGSAAPVVAPIATPAQ